MVYYFCDYIMINKTLNSTYCTVGTVHILDLKYILKF